MAVNLCISSINDYICYVLYTALDLGNVILGEVKSTKQEMKNTADTIQSELLNRICYLEYQAGDQLKEAELGAKFGVSRTPVRDAINRINHLGLVETQNGVGTVVVALSAVKINELRP